MEWIALALICPLTMGLMMLFMMRGMRDGHERGRTMEHDRSVPDRQPEAQVEVDAVPRP